MNRWFVAGVVIVAIGIVLTAGSTQFLPDIKPFLTCALVTLAGVGVVF